MNIRWPDHTLPQTYASGVTFESGDYAVLHLDFLAIEGPEQAVVVQRVALDSTALETVADQLLAVIANRRKKGWPVSSFDLPESDVGADGVA